MRNPTGRFSDRVTDYLRARPLYPEALLEILRERCGLRSSWRVADVGSGPGNLSRLFLDHGNPVAGVEPNAEMRAAGERALAGYQGFTSVDGRAESTELATASVDLIAAAQAFHWFDPGPTRAEFARILRPSGYVLLVWNDRDEQASALMRGYEALLRKHGTDYHEVHHRKLGTDRIRSFYGHDGFTVEDLPNRQRLDLDSLRARVRSSSYVPAIGSPGHDPLMRAVDGLFAEHEGDGTIELLYRTRVYYGSLTG